MQKTEKKNKVELTAVIEGKAWQDALEKAFKKKNKDVKIDGFRPGKAPRDVYEKKYGRESLYLDAANVVVGEALGKVLTENKLEPVVEPSVDIKSIDDEKIEFTFVITTKPEIKIKKYKGLKVKKAEVVVTEDEVNHEIEHLRERFAELTDKDGKVENRDTVIINYEGFLDSVPFEGGKADNYTLEIGSNTFIPGFEDGLIGMTVGSSKDVNVTFPEDYHEESLKGKAVIFKVTLNEIKTKKLPDYDEQFFADLGMEGIDSKDKLFEEVKKSIEAHHTMDVENKYVDELLKAVSENTEVEIPDEMIEEEIDRLLKRYESQLKMQGITLDLYYQFTNTKEEDLRKNLMEQAKNNTLYRLVLEELIKLENVTVTHEEAHDQVHVLMDKYHVTEEELLKEFGGLEMIQYDLLIRKVFDLLKEYNK